MINNNSYNDYIESLYIIKEAINSRIHTFKNNKDYSQLHQYTILQIQDEAMLSILEALKEEIIESNEIIKTIFEKE